MFFLVYKMNGNLVSLLDLYSLKVKTSYRKIS